MGRTGLGAVTALAVTVVLAGCSSSSGGSPPSPAAAAAATSAAATSGGGSGADLKVASTSLGSIVVDGQGRTAYYFDKDTAGSGSSVCSGECLAAWPSIAPAADPPTVDGVTAEVGTIKRDDGTTQITVSGRPVYLFVKDTAPGQVTGQGVGGVWYVIAPDGTEVKKPAG